MKAAIYIRVSTHEQANEGYSVPAQKNRSIAYCESQGWEIYDFYVDEGRSAKDTDREELQRLLADAKLSKFDVIVVYRLDRLTRSVLDLYTILADMEKHNIMFKSVTEVYDTTTATGRLFITLVAALAQWERENLAERVYFGMEEKVNQGQRPGGTVCYGYKSENGLLIPDEVQSRIVKMIYNMYEKNQSIRSIQLHLEAEDIPPPKIHWSTTTINYMLRNPVYIGKLRWNLRKRGKGKTGNEIVVDGEHEAIIPEIQFHRVQNLINLRRNTAPAAATSDFLFSGILKCGKCGYSMSGTSRKYKTVRTKYYACVNRQKNFKCSMPYVREDSLIDAVLKFVETALSEHSDTADYVLQNEAVPSISITPEKLTELNNELEKIEQRKKKFQNMYIDELLSRDDYIKRKSELDREQAMVVATIKELAAEAESDEGSEDIQFILENFIESFRSLDQDEQKVLCQEIFKTITLRDVDTNDNVNNKFKLTVVYN